eukprot:2773717-Ditylum_brightwellii.AAC.1
MLGPVMAPPTPQVHQAPEQTPPQHIVAKVKSPKEVYRMCKTKLANTLKLCSLDEEDFDSLPAWFKQVLEKGQNDNTKNLAIMKALQDTIYNEAE